ncbi:hypothetical protein FDUTEX481_08619 [Tolypothrix sp. PCC 7601]|nr:hypothetical protein FDUTEX481_08619 [Tolypothrix sp. PCC 7601]BAY89772.1 hypothetical protein NIES3275_17750 [Microchaete diplosiphon NIES-3275]
MKQSVTESNQSAILSYLLYILHQSDINLDETKLVYLFSEKFISSLQYFLKVKALLQLSQESQITLFLGKYMHLYFTSICVFFMQIVLKNTIFCLLNTILLFNKKFKDI